MSEALPLVRERQVEISARVPGYQDVEFSPDAYGAGIGRALVKTSETLNGLGDMFAQLKADRQANDALANVNSAKDELREKMYNPNSGIFSRFGGAASGAGQDTAAITNGIRDKYLESITDPATREAWLKLWDREAETAKDKAAVHELGQLGNYKQDVTKATLIGSMQKAYDAYNDPEVVKNAMLDAEEAIRVNSLGQPEEMIAAQIMESNSKIRLAVISRLADEDPVKAQEYYKEHKNDITGPDHTTATQFIAPLLADQRKRQAAAGIMRTGGVQTQKLYAAVQFAESSNNPNAESVDGAVGLMQLMPETARYVARRLGMTELASMDDDSIKAYLKKDETVNQQLGQAYLDEQLTKFNGDIEAALVAYNAGPGRAEVFLNHNAGVPPGQRDYNIPGYEFLEKETRPYVEKIMGQYNGNSAPRTPGSNVDRYTPQNWPLRNFTQEDILAPTPGGQWVDARAANGLDGLADDFYAMFPGTKIKINEKRSAAGDSAGRRRGTSDPKDNPHVQNSQHIHGTAFDVQIQGMTTEQKAAFLSMARARGFSGVGFYGDAGHLHIDMGRERTWGPVPAWAKSAMATPVGKVADIQASGSMPSSIQTNVGGAQGTAPGMPGSYYVGLQPPALASWLEQANQIVDPTLRAGVIDEINLQGAKAKGQYEQAFAALKQQAWETVVNGSVKDLPPQMIMQLGDDFTKSLMSYEKARDSGGVQQDWAAWSKFSGMDEEQLASEDIYTNWRNKLDDSHFDKALEMQRAAVKAQSGDEKAKTMMAGLRTRQQILSDTFNAMNWRDSNEYDSKKIGEFSKQVDARILSEQSVLKRELNAVEIQDIVDKLVLTGTLPGTIYDGSQQAFLLEPKELETFQAAEDWDAVQADDQEVFVGTYRNYFGEDPDRERATDLYNRSMRVWLGGQPEITADEDTFIREALTAARPNIVLTDRMIKDASRKWLLTFLGR